MTVFGPPWDQLELQDLATFLKGAPAEPLEWEAKADVNPGSVRAQVCGFANGYAAGSLILGAHDQGGGTWALDGAEFPNADPPSDVTNLLHGPSGVAPYPEGLDVRAFEVGDRRHVAVVRIPPVPDPPCMTRGTVFERVSGKTIAVTDPIRLATLFGRGDVARRAGVEKAERIAAQILATEPESSETAQFGLGLAIPGYGIDLTPILFTPRIHGAAGQIVEAVSGDERHLRPFAPRLAPSVTQDGWTFELTAVDGRFGDFWNVRVSREGAVGIRWATVQGSSSPAAFVGGGFRHAWQCAHALLDLLGRQEARDLHLLAGLEPRSR